jgi:hypothetical protein
MAGLAFLYIDFIDREIHETPLILSSMDGLYLRGI